MGGDRVQRIQSGNRLGSSTSRVDHSGFPSGNRARGLAQDLAKGLLTQEERARLWPSLSDLIGSSDGKKLRVFAPGPTLDILLAETNEFLRELAPPCRYSRPRKSSSGRGMKARAMTPECSSRLTISCRDRQRSLSKPRTIWAGYGRALTGVIGVPVVCDRRRHSGSFEMLKLW